MDIRDLRVYRGRNVYCMKPVVKLTLALDNHEHRPTCEFPGLHDRLLLAFPGLATHRCATGEEGGFLKRLREGTYPCHVAEHAILALQNALGYDVGYGATRQLDGAAYAVVYRYVNEPVAVACGKAVARLLTAWMAGEDVDAAPLIGELSALAGRTDLGPSTLAIRDEARRRGIPVARLGEGSQLVLGTGCHARRVEAAMTDAAPAIAVDTAADKHLTKRLLAELGLPVPCGELVYSADAAGRAAGEIGYPVVVKPADSNHGNGVSLNLQCAEQVAAAFEAASQFGDSAIVERYVEGRDWRVLVVGGRVSAVAERRAPHVVGDGASTVAALVEAENKNPLRGVGHQRPLTAIPLDEAALDALAEQGLTLDSTPAAGRAVALRKNANLSTGGTARACPGELHPANARLAVRAAQALGLDIAGIDLCAPSIDRPIEETGGAILEVNAGPGLRMHLAPSEGPPADVAGDIVSMLFPDNHPHSVPIVSITGTNGKTTTARLVAHALSLQGLAVGLATTDGAYAGGERLLDGDCSGSDSAQLLLRHRAVEAAVLETARGGIVKRGLGYDLADVGVVTNLGDDHLGLDGIHTMRDLAHVKSLVVEAVKPDGRAVLNADDPMVEFFLQRARCKAILFGWDARGPHLSRHLARGGDAVFVEREGIWLRRGGRRSPVARVDAIPIAFGGTAACNVENAMAAAGALMALGMEGAAIGAALCSFLPDEAHSRGRFNLFSVGEARVMLDYGHNPDGYAQAIAFLERQGARRLVGVIGVPGDRRDDAIERIGRLCGRRFHRLIVKEDQDLRGRAPGDVAARLCAAAREAGGPALPIDIIPSELAALSRALDEARPGDLIAMFFEHYAPLREMLRSRAARAINPEPLHWAPV
ncbi:MAG: cyanophycin synthetase [Clostridiales bacterium]|nr:cyanophycin synthetase [Clostridiales bacterium]